MRDNHVADTPEPRPAHVSPWMLYDNARVYDEWEGEDYEGSSCRGAMKGWHKHGACHEGLWQRLSRSNSRPDPDWRSDAALRPLGAYYRVDARSIGDMQAAVHEVRAVYCAARVHEGWMLDGAQQTVTIAGLKVPVIKLVEEISGGHAFAIVGYTVDGFIVQNSWGPEWGMKGFALLTYEDWVRNGDDAWVAAMAAPTRVAERTTVAVGRALAPMQFTTATLAAAGDARDKTPPPWSESRAYEHAVVMGNNGKLLRRLVDTADAEDNLRKVVIDLPREAIDKGKKHILVYAHGGLNSENAAMERVMRMGPWFDANGIHPIFIVWRTSLLESIGQIGEDFVEQFQKEKAELRSRGLGDLFDRALDKLQGAFDKAFETAAEKVGGKAVWSQMKQNAEAAATRKGGSRQIVIALRELRAEHPDLSLHMLGHSAGSIMLGHMLDDLDVESGLETVGLYAPACTLRFAIGHYGKALRKGVIGAGKLHVDNLTDDLERDDTVGPYGKSLLYLVSRAFENPRKMPLLGLAGCWDPDSNDLGELKKKLGADFAESHVRDIRDWDEIADGFGVVPTVLGKPEVVIKTSKDGDEQIKTAHGSFDNDIATVNASISRILGTPRPKTPITDLRGF